MRILGVVACGLLTLVLGTICFAGGGLPSPRELPASSPLFTKNTMDAVLAGLNPPVAANQVAPGNDLLLDFPDVVAAGKVRVRLLSAMPRTENLWLISNIPDPDTGGVLLASYSFEGGVPPEVVVPIHVEKTQMLMLLAKVAGRYYGVQREIKVGQASHGRKAKR